MNEYAYIDAVFLVDCREAASEHGYLTMKQVETLFWGVASDIRDAEVAQGTPAHLIEEEVRRNVVPKVANWLRTQGVKVCAA